jgi:hypothetical protein
MAVREPCFSETETLSPRLIVGSTVFARMQSESAADRIHGALQALAHALRVGSTSTSRPGPAATSLNRRFKLTFVGQRARVTVA